MGLKNNDVLSFFIQRPVLCSQLFCSCIKISGCAFPDLWLIFAIASIVIKLVASG